VFARLFDRKKKREDRTGLPGISQKKGNLSTTPKKKKKKRTSCCRGVQEERKGKGEGERSLGTREKTLLSTRKKGENSEPPHRGRLLSCLQKGERRNAWRKKKEKKTLLFPIPTGKGKKITCRRRLWKGGRNLCAGGGKEKKEGKGLEWRGGGSTHRRGGNGRYFFLLVGKKGGNLRTEEKKSPKAFRLAKIGKCGETMQLNRYSWEGGCPSLTGRREKTRKML